MRVLSLFDGISCGMVALNRLGIKPEVYDAYEIEPNAIKISEANYPEINHKGDVFKAVYQEGEYDLLIGGSPCLTADSLILTKNGYKKLGDVIVGDMVLTHAGVYQKVINVFNNGVKDIFKLRGMAFDSIKATGNHKFFARKKEYYYKQNASGNSVKYRRFLKPEWTELNTIKKSHKDYYLGCAINNESIIPEWSGTEYNVNQFTKKAKHDLKMDDPNLWYLTGRWLGDGWFKKRKGKMRHNKSAVVICCGKHKVEDFKKKISSSFPYTMVETRTTMNFQFFDIEFASFLTQFGEYAIGKKLPSFMYDLPVELLKSFLEGYFDSDGYHKENLIVVSSISKELIYGIGMCVLKVYHRPFLISYRTYKGKRSFIEGREVHCKDSWSLTFAPETRKQDHAFYEDGYIWYPITEIIENGQAEVFDIEVENDHSFIANNCIVHNCTFWSIAQKGNDRETTSSGMGWNLFSQYVRALREAKPKYFLYENNYSMSKEIKAEITKYLGVEPIMINSALLSAQNRKRYYWTNIPDVIEPEDNGILLKDIIEHGKVDRDKSLCLCRRYAGFTGSQSYLCRRYFGKSFAQAVFEGDIEEIKNKWKDNSRFEDNGEVNIRPLTIKECERLQTLPDDYTNVEGVSRQMRIECIGNGWTADVIKHILSYIPKGTL